jgi:hypothetical protein
MSHGKGTTQLSLAVIVSYCFITIAYITYIIITGRTSVAWNSATELIILALQSKEPNNLGHVSVGIDSMETLCRSVGIRVNDVQDKQRMLKKVERNQAY